MITFCATAQEVPVNERSLTNSLKELSLELKTLHGQIPETQQLFDNDYERQHQRMLDVITQTNKLSILLYSQEQKRTFDMAYALKKVTISYNDFNQGMLPYEQIINDLNFEIERYARLIEALRRLPPEMEGIVEDEEKDAQ